ncbi:DUF1104 domain-containing protein [Helicobacter suis]|uniref:DUF1104 domain-containing protein n=1 Tax=Helicobacter suis TaxID=104628 RepID=A0A6J4CZG9_9HELI|nr:DUF1104 domain-containing protein [Helicobacter suis]BCD46266.1 hypothetical protein NHP190020_13050 [Helicobacter suis]BCD47820.1 hypothetical protein NHP194003_10240 [Helicobacter suis]BCD49579.1 hypothetical protein NHP194004_10260 [Helicobacter suis]BCD50942.1 hypothetical protein NHP194022_06130 [Helicobacter suis]BCD70605.1 hypothetical protein SNTW_12500 [Helicobacter suis]
MTKVKLGIAGLVIAGLCTGLLAESNPFESKSDKELIDMAGKVVPNQVPDYKMELFKRMKKMNADQKKKLYDELKASADKNTANMTMEEFEKRRQAIRAAIKARVAKMTRAQFKASGLAGKACGCHAKCNCDIVGPCTCGGEHKHKH